MDPRLSLIYSRRSIRRFDGRPIPRELLDELLAAAMAAPSANDNRPWEFVVITGASRRATVAQCHPFAHFAAEAGAVIVLFGDRGAPLLEQTLSAATENLLLAAAGLGLGACWCGMNAERQGPIRELTGIPGGKWIVSLVCVGFPAETKEPRTHFDPARVHWERYGGKAPRAG